MPFREPGAFTATRAAPFVGRERELARLRVRLAAQQRAGGVVLVAGEPGIGKTRLAHKLAGEVRTAGTAAL